MRRIVILLAFLFAASAVFAQPMSLALDAADVARGVLHAHETIPATAGAMTLLYPKWIPGEHGPTGPIAGLVNVQISANGQRLAWRRDPVEMYALHFDVPQGVSSIDVSLDSLLPSGGQFSGGRTATAVLAVISWNTAVLFPQGRSADDIMVAPSLRLPAGFKYATALPLDHASGDTLTFKEAPLSTVIDSPVQIGIHQTIVHLQDADGRPHEIDMVADSDSALELPKDFGATYDRLVEQAGLVFGGRHYRDYHWLLTLSDNVAHFGLEHHESSDDRVSENSLESASGRRNIAGLLAHEYVHSWNGKYRRPAGLMSPDYMKPMQGELLWVYEGLTEYWSFILPPRFGAWTPEQAREHIATTAGDLESEGGRTWRPLADTAVEAQVLFGSGGAWWATRRGTDFYAESFFVWLDADTLIRQLSGDKKSLDDFTRAFYGTLTGPQVKPYTFDDLVAAMNAVQPYDWRTFFNTHLSSVDPHLSMTGLERAGWKLVFDDKAPKRDEEARMRDRGALNFRTGIGLMLAENGAVRDVTPGGPAMRAGISPGFQIISVNGRKFSADAMREGLRASTTSTQPIDLIAENGDFVGVYHIDYHGGLRYPHLVRDETKKDVLSVIMTPLKK